MGGCGEESVGGGLLVVMVLLGVGVRGRGGMETDLFRRVIVAFVFVR